MKRTGFFVTIVTFLLLIAGCQTTAYIQTEESRGLTLKRSDPGKIAILIDEPLPKDVTILGQVIAAIDGGKNTQGTIYLLKEQAANLGADAITDIELETDYGYWDSGVKISGTAVKYK